MSSAKVMKVIWGCWGIFLHCAMILCRRYASGISQLHMVSTLGLVIARTLRFSARDNTYSYRDQYCSANTIRMGPSLQ